MNAPKTPKPGEGAHDQAPQTDAVGPERARGRLTPVPPAKPAAEAGKGLRPGPRGDKAPGPGDRRPPEPKPAPQAAQGSPPASKGGEEADLPAKTPGRSAPAKTKPKPAPAKAPETPAPQSGGPAIPDPVPKGRLRRRHVAVMVSFVVLVLLPAAVAAWYLWARAADQYASRVGFSVRTEEAASAIESVLGPLNLSGSSTSDTDILYEFIQSQGLVAKIDDQVDLRAIWSKPENDPVFAYSPPGTIEDLLAHWERKVKIYYDGGSGLIELEVRAFTPEDAQRIAERIFAESTAMINELSAIAREDAIRYARDELETSVERLKQAREALTRFRNRTQIVDPTVDLQGQAGLLNTLNQQLAQALIELDLLRDTTRENDPRIAQAERRIKVIEARIEEERKKLGIGGGSASGDDDAFATLLGEYERLSVDRQFAEEAYRAALAAYDAAQAEARRQSRYLAAHVRPTLAEKAEYPERGTLLVLITVFLFLIWSVLVLVAYAIRDRS